jgi:hypothetical protein
LALNTKLPDLGQRATAILSNLRDHRGSARVFADCGCSAGELRQTALLWGEIYRCSKGRITDSARQLRLDAREILFHGASSLRLSFYRPYPHRRPNTDGPSENGSPFGGTMHRPGIVNLTRSSRPSGPFLLRGGSAIGVPRTSLHRTAAPPTAEGYHPCLS